MDYLKHELQESNLGHWTKLTAECYSIGCMCSICTFVPEDIRRNYKCKAKDYALELYRRFGKPTKESLDVEH